MSTLSKQKLDDSIVNIKETWDHLRTEDVIDKKNKQKKIKFKFSKIIGRGSFGIVLKIKDDIGNFFALKKVFQDKRYFNRELDLLINISHPHIINLNSYFYSEHCEFGRYLNIIMDYHPYNLEDLISNRQDFGSERILKYYKQVLDALIYLHGMKICHRDIKPSNILIDEYDNVRLCDFGSAKIIEENASNISYICSRYYRAPENLLGITTYTCKIDVWSTACVFAELRTYAPIFKSSSNTGTLNRICEILQISEADFLELNCDRERSMNTPGITKYLSKFFDDENLLYLFEKSLVFSPLKRFSSKELRESFAFKKM